MCQGPVGVLEMWDHAFPRIDFGGLNLPSRARFPLAPVIPSAATGLYTFNTAGFLLLEQTWFTQRTTPKLRFCLLLDFGCSWFLCQYLRQG